MEYLVIARGFNEPDNNTPSDEIWARVYEIEPDKVEEKDKEITAYWEEDYPNGVSVEFFPLSDVKEGWRKISVIW